MNSAVDTLNLVIKGDAHIIDIVLMLQLDYYASK